MNFPKQCLTTNSGLLKERFRSFLRTLILTGVGQSNSTNLFAQSVDPWMMSERRSPCELLKHWTKMETDGSTSMISEVFIKLISILMFSREKRMKIRFSKNFLKLLKLLTPWETTKLQTTLWPKKNSKNTTITFLLLLTMMTTTSWWSRTLGSLMRSRNKAPELKDGPHKTDPHKQSHRQRKMTVHSLKMLPNSSSLIM